MFVSRTRTKRSAKSLMRSRRTTCPSNTRQLVQGTQRSTTISGLPVCCACCLPALRLDIHPLRAVDCSPPLRPPCALAVPSCSTRPASASTATTGLLINSLPIPPPNLPPPRGGLGGDYRSQSSVVRSAQTLSAP